jgi:secreted PhoX family phosphatase
MAVNRDQDQSGSETGGTSVGRRRFIGLSGLALTMGFGGLRTSASGIVTPRRGAGTTRAGDWYGPLRRDPAGILDLPEGFHYTAFSRFGDEMDDGLLVPGQHDGMSVFPIDDRHCLLLRNHELNTNVADRFGAFGLNNERLDRVNSDLIYDLGTAEGSAVPGGVSTVLFDLKANAPVKHWLSLAGTGHNCAGGPTPWGSWLSCEEWTQKKDALHARDHGYVFEVPATTTMGLVPAVPIKSMGRFLHEAVAVAPAADVVYLTEDRGDSAIYRYLPKTPGKLADGGRLQALKIAEQPSLDTRNWTTESGPKILQGQSFETSWFDLEDIEAPQDDLRYRAFDAGAARFARGEGIWHGGDCVYWACTTGGEKQLGQIFRYVPSPGEGTDSEMKSPGRMELFVESGDADIIGNADNLTMAACGDIYLCEDSAANDGMTRITPKGEIERFATNRLNDSELAGVCFSPDGSTLFVNMQTPGTTFAIKGPWRNAKTNAKTNAKSSKDV